MLRMLPPWVYPAAGAALLAVGFIGGWKVQGWRCESAKLEAVQKALKRAEEARAKVQDEATKYEQDREHARQQGIERETRIRTIYRTVEVPAVCEPPPDAGRLLDDAIRDANARAGGQPQSGLPGPTG